MEAGMPVTPKNKRGRGEWIVAGIALVIGLSILGTMITPKSSEERLAEHAAKVGAEMKAEEEKRDSAVSVTAVELYRAYDANEARAQRDYGDRPLEVTGTIASISLGFGDVPFLELATDNQFMSAHVELSKEGEAASVVLSKGQEIRLLCEGISEIGGRPMLKDCDIV